MVKDVVEEYRSYLMRFDRLAGQKDFGAPVKWKGRLCSKLSYDQFENRLFEFHDLLANYEELLSRGDTIADGLLKQLRDRAAEMLFEKDYE